MIIQMKSFIIMIQIGTVLDRFKQGLCWIYIVFKVLKLVIFPGTALNELSFPRGTDAAAVEESRVMLLLLLLLLSLLLRRL